MDHNKTMNATAILQTSDLKKNTGKILDAARRTPQFIVRNGSLFQITLKELPVEPRQLPVGYFAEEPDSERLALEAQSTRVRQHPER